MKKLILSTLLAFSSLSQAEVIHVYAPTGFLEASFERNRVVNYTQTDGTWTVFTGIVVIAPTADSARNAIYTIIDDCRNTWGLMRYNFTIGGEMREFPWDYAKGTGTADRLAKAICAVGARKLMGAQ